MKYTFTIDAAEIIAQRFHEAYERLAPSYGYRTREASAVPWEQVPEQNRALMIATVREVFKDETPATPWPGATPNKRNDDDCTCLSAPGALCPACHAGYGR